jgi:hypothetical protein
VGRCTGPRKSGGSAGGVRFGLTGSSGGRLVHLGKAVGADPVRDLRTGVQVEASGYGRGNLLPFASGEPDATTVGA